MFAKIKPSIFIDALQLELSSANGSPLKAVLRDETGSVCGSMEKSINCEKEAFTWSGLNDLPYGTYTLELSQGGDQMQMRLVKRV